MANKTQTISISYFIALCLLLVSCSSPPKTTVSGVIDYLGNASLLLELPPLHYKYSPKEVYPFTKSGDRFELQLSLNSPVIAFLMVQDQRYPVYLQPGTQTTFEIKRAAFPKSISLSGQGELANTSYSQFVAKSSGLQTRIAAEMEKAKIGLPNNALELATRKLELTETHFKGSPFNDFYLKTIGENLVLQLRTVEYSARHNAKFDADSARQEIIAKALGADFFSFESLKAQRAGIRDFIHYYARTFGIYDSVQQQYTAELSEYDIKRLAYAPLNEKRIEVLPYITEPKAMAYAQLFLVAERIGEIPLEEAESSYQNYITTYTDYPEFIEFITWFYQEINSVSPGQPAIAFTLPDRDGTIFSMDDFAGKFVLLDFWAGWCQPCLAEFPHMRDLYSRYSREELEIVGISTEIDRKVWLSDINRFKNPWPQLYGGNGFEQQTFKGYKGGGIPFYILVDPEGNISRYNDVRPSFNFTQVLDSLLTDYNSN